MAAPGSAPPRRKTVVATALSRSLAGLDLRQLRAHRDLLAAEDDVVSYWTCLTQVRIESLATQTDAPTPLTRGQLARALGATGSGRRRHQIAGQVTSCRLPALPDVTGMWACDVDPRDLPLVAQALSALQPAERQLVAYSSALHDLMDDSTRELIMRYRSDPSKALDALPAA